MSPTLKLDIKNRIGDGLHGTRVIPTYPSKVSGRLNGPSLLADKGLLRTFAAQAGEFGGNTAPIEKYLARVGELEAAASDIRKEKFSDNERALTVALASGATTPEEALKTYGRLAGEQDFQRSVLKRASLLEQASARARHSAAALAASGAADLVYRCQAVVRGALESPGSSKSEGLYARAIGLHGLLIGWLLHAADGATMTEYQFGRPDLLWGWQLERAQDVKEIGRGVPHHDSDGVVSVRVFLNLIGAPFPGLKDIAEHPEWRPGPYTAEQVVSNASAFAPLR